jgi:hypothetical protein
MWHWDQGHLPYFQFDSLRQISSFVLANDFKAADRSNLLAATGLSFAAPATHSPWRNYSRVLKLCLLVSEVGNKAVPTAVAKLLAQPGAVTSDEYFHFLARVFTEPSPALEGWSPSLSFRFPLAFSLKYLLTKRAVAKDPIAGLDEVIGAYRISGFTGDEDETGFIGLLGSVAKYQHSGATAPDNLRRQARESLKVLCQISYLHLSGSNIITSLDPADAAIVFSAMDQIGRTPALDAQSEIRRLSDMFKVGSTDDFFEYPNTVVNDVLESGFAEGTKVKKTHITIERNSNLRVAFFAARPGAVCDVCELDTAATYPWTDRILDLHHLLPLSSGTRVEASGTTFADLVPLCPNCHRAIHRYYDRWLKDSKKKDFADVAEAKALYNKARTDFGGPVYA